MSTWAARYVRLRNKDADAVKLRAQLGDAATHLLTIEPQASFAMIVVVSPSLQPDDLAPLSSDFGEAFSLQGQTVADMIIYDHFKDGARARGFTYAGEAGWTRVVGEPEPWEASHFFAPSRLDDLLEELDADLDDPATLEREQNELRRLWQKARLEEGSTRPLVELNSLTRALTKHYGLPIPPTRPSTTKQKIAG
jgi:hypothetical protein